MICFYYRQSIEKTCPVKDCKHWSCWFMERAVEIIHKNSWGNPPEKLMEDVIDSPIKQAEVILQNYQQKEDKCR